MIALVEVQEGIELRLPGEQLFQPLLVLERAIRLRLIVRKLLLDADHSILLLRCEAVEISQGVFDALDSPNGVRGVEVCRIRGSSAYKELRQTLVLLQHSESAAPSSAQDLETPEITAWLRRLIVTPGEYCERQSLGRFLPRAFAGELQSY